MQNTHVTRLKVHLTLDSLGKLFREFSTSYGIGSSKLFLEGEFSSKFPYTNPSSFLVILIQPVLTIINVTLTLVLVFTSIVWVPLAVYLFSLLNIFIFDFDGKQFRISIPYFSLFITILWTFMIRGVLRILFALFLALLAHPLASIGVFVLGTLRALCRHFYDVFM